MLGLGFDQLGKLLSTLQASALHVHPEYCSRLRHKNSKCALCSNSCPTHAIEWTATLKIDPDKCNGCGICANICRNGVFEAMKPTDEEILATVKLMLDDGQAIIFACEGPKGTDFAQERQNGPLIVSCLARLDEAVLIGSVALGAKSVWLVNGACQGCGYESSRHVAEETVKDANGLTSLFGLPKRISFIREKIDSHTIEERPAELASISRRDFFRNMAREIQKTGALLAGSVIASYTHHDADKPKKGGTKLPIRLPEKRRLLLSSMKGLGSLTEKVSEAESPLFCHFEIDENCTGCQMCAFFCPTGALCKFEEEGNAGVNFKISNCTACGLCQEVCYKQAVRLSQSIDYGKVIDGDIEVISMREEPFLFPGQHL
jgi:ferredoxin